MSEKQNEKKKEKTKMNLFVSHNSAEEKTQ